jgi:predicted nucleotidyltransferase
MNLLPVEILALRDAFSGLASVRLVLVFGSVARGTARSDSDIDVAVLANHTLSASEKMSLIEAIAQATGRPVDLVDLTTAGQPLVGQILRDSYRLIGSADTQADLATRAVLDAQDFLPYVQRMLKQRRLAWIG